MPNAAILSKKKISPRELHQGSPDGSMILLDVRTPAEFEEVHVEGARLTPLDSFDAESISRELGGKAVCLICESGKRADAALRKLEAAGCGEACLLTGGMQAWIEAELPVNRGRKTMSLERQVRIAAGALVVLGVVLGWQVHPALYGLSAFVGAGLMFAGITDTCAMGMFMAKMPWNQRRPSSASSS